MNDKSIEEEKNKTTLNKESNNQTVSEQFQQNQPEDLVKIPSLKSLDEAKNEVQSFPENALDSGALEHNVPTPSKSQKSGVFTNVPGERLCKKDIFVKKCSSCAYQEKFTLQDLNQALSLSNMNDDVFHTAGLQWRESKVLHKMHDKIEDGYAEVREVDSSGQVKLSLIPWVDVVGAHDDRWETNILNSLKSEILDTETEEASDENKGLDVRYDRNRLPLKESRASIKLDIIQDLEPEDDGQSLKTHKSWNSFQLENKKSPSSRTNLDFSDDARTSQGPNSEMDRRLSIINKLWNLYAQLEENGVFQGPPLFLKVREQVILDDSFFLLMSPSKLPLKYYRFIKVYLIYGSKSVITNKDVDFTQADQTDDFYQCMAENLFSSSVKVLFERPSKESECIYPNPVSSSHPQLFEYAGVILALSIVHQSPLLVRLPECFFKCILDRPLRLSDLQELDPLFYDKLLWIKENDVTGRKIPYTVKEKFDRVSMHANLNTLDDMYVTEENKFRYIEESARWKLAEGCLHELKSIRKGFQSILDPHLLSNFTESDLQQLCLAPLHEITCIEDLKSSQLPYTAKQNVESK